MNEWKSLAVKSSELALNLTLSCGQSFRWRKVKSDHSEKEAPNESRDIWRSVIGEHVYSLQQQKNKLSYYCHQSAAPKSEAADAHVVDPEEVLKDYFNLSVSLEKLSTYWSSVDEHFEKVSKRFSGIRILRQDPVENLFSFICSSNNNISRISSLVHKLCENFGREIAEIDGIKYFSFPNVVDLANSDVEQQLRQLGFGYRAKYIHETAKILAEKKDPKSWLKSFREKSYQETHQQLIQFVGVGSKVADCICLMSLDKMNAIPVDTHVWQIVCKYYLPEMRSKTLTKSIYLQIGDFFRQLFGEYAGWAHSILFTSDLKTFQIQPEEKKPNLKRPKNHQKNHNEFSDQKKPLRDKTNQKSM